MNVQNFDPAGVIGKLPPAIVGIRVNVPVVLVAVARERISGVTGIATGVEGLLQAVLAVGLLIQIAEVTSPTLLGGYALCVGGEIGVKQHHATVAERASIAFRLAGGVYGENIPGQIRTELAVVLQVKEVETLLATGRVIGIVRIRADSQICVLIVIVLITRGLDRPEADFVRNARNEDAGQILRSDPAGGFLQHRVDVDHAGVGHQVP